MKVRYEFEIDKQEYHEFLCEGCPMLQQDDEYIYCELNVVAVPFFEKHSTATHRFDAMSYLESKCPLEVVG